MFAQPRPRLHPRRIRAVTHVLALACLACAPPLAAQGGTAGEAQSAFDSQEYQKALEIWMLLAYEGDPEAQFRLGTMFADGIGTVVDPAEAVYWYTRAAEQGHAQAQFMLGSALINGRGVESDTEAGLEWWRLAAGAGDVNAQYNLGRAYFYGIDVEQNTAVSMRWMREAADQGDERASEFLNRVSAESAPATADERLARIGDEATFVQAGFNRLSPIITEIAAATPIRIVDRNGGWFRVRVPGGLPLWVSRSRVAITNGSARIAGDGVVARPEPSAAVDSIAVGMLSVGEELVVVEERDDWIQVRAPERIGGWVEALAVDESEIASATFEQQWNEHRSRVMAELGRERQTAASADDATGADSDTVESAATLDVDGSRAGREVVVQAPPGPGPEPASASSDDAIAATAQAAEVPPEPAAVDPSSLAEGSYVRAGREALVARALNRADAAVVDRIAPGTLLRVIERRPGWLLVERPGGFAAWAFGRYVEIGDGTAVVTASNVRARPVPNTSSQSVPIGSFEENEPYRIAEIRDGWVQLVVPRGVAAWVTDTGLVTVAVGRAEIDAQWAEQAAGRIDFWERFDADVAAAGAVPVQDLPAQAEGASVAVAEPARPDPPAPAGEPAPGGDDGEPAPGPTVPMLESMVAAMPALSPVQGSRPVEPSEPAAEGDDGTDTAAPTARPGAASEGPGAITAASSRDGGAPMVGDEAAAVGDEPAPAESVAIEDGQASSTAEAEIASGIDGSGETAVVEAEAADEPVEGPVASGTTQDDGASGAAPSGDAADPGQASTEAASEPLDEDRSAVPGRVEQSASEGSEAVAAAGDDGGQESAASAAEPMVDVAPETVATADAIGPADPESIAPADMEEQTGAVATSDSGGAEATMDGPDGTDATAATEAAGEADALDAETTGDASSDADGEAAAEEGAAREALVVAADSSPVADNGAAPVPGVEGEGPDTERPPASPASHGEDQADAGKPAQPARGPRHNDFEWLFAQDPERFSIELLRASSETVVRRFIAGGEYDDSVVYFDGRDGEDPLFLVLHGSYRSIQEAGAAVEAMNDPIDSMRIRRFGSLQRQRCEIVDKLPAEQLLALARFCSRLGGQSPVAGD